MQRLGTYLPQDRLRSLARGEELPVHTRGAALFADISGFTLFTEQLTQQYGPRKGVDELSLLLNRVYGALIDQVEAYGGVIISFAGDSILGWFEEHHEPSAAWRAVTCAQAIQTAMQEFAGLSFKICITSGPARRFVVGDPAIQYLDTLVGQTVARLAVGERLAEKGQILLDESTCRLLGGRIATFDGQAGEAGDGPFHRLDALLTPAAPQPLEPLSDSAVPEERLRPWLLPTVFEHERSDLVSFLTELRPVVPLFVRFSGLDYDNDEGAADKLKAFIIHAQRVIHKRAGSLLQLVTGDKGNYIYAVFGAPIAHEDDAQRAVQTALELIQIPRQLEFIQSVQIGIGLGTMRVGAYGSSTRRTYSALGDGVNLAARLMTSAAPGEILVSGRIQLEVSESFDLQPRAPIQMKGKQEPQPLYSVIGSAHQRATRLPEPGYRLPMVGRQDELAQVEQKLNLALQGRGQVLGIVAEAGMGKSRLVAEIIRLARKRGFVGYGGACQSSGTRTPYLVWQAIWQAFFDLDPEMPQRKQVRLLEVVIEDLAPARHASLPLLGVVLDLPLPENDFTRALDPQDRKNALEALLEDCLRSQAQESPLLFVLEDLHWADPASADLLATLARLSADLPVCFVLAYRPPDAARPVTPQHESLPCFTAIHLKELTKAEAGQLIRAKLGQLFPERSGPPPGALVNELIARSQGNPFFIEELLNYLHDRGLNPYEERALDSLDLPASLQTLILSRIDQLTEPQKITLKVASVIGRIFPFMWLRGYYPSLGDEDFIKKNLLELSRLELTPLDTPEPELAYLFKHIITQEVAYESLSYNTRSQLHEKLAQYLEASYPDDPPLNVLAYHYSRSNNQAKKREYLRRSGEAAQAAYSNAPALEYYEQALASAPPPPEAIDLHLRIGLIQQMLANYDLARSHFDQALQLAQAGHMEEQIIKSRLKIGTWLGSRGEYRQAIEWLHATLAMAERIHDEEGAAEALGEIGTAHWRIGQADIGRPFLARSIEIAGRLGNRKQESASRLVMASLMAEQGQYAGSHAEFEIVFRLARETSDKRRLASALLNSGTTYYYQGNYQVARERIEQCLNAAREIGDKRTAAIATNNLGNTFFLEADYQTAGRYYADALSLARATSDRYLMSISLASLGITAFQLGDLSAAETHYLEALAISRELGNKTELSLLNCYLGLLALQRAQVGEARAHFREGLDIAFGMNAKSYILYNLVGMGCLFQAEGHLSRSVTVLGAVSAYAAAIGFKLEIEIEQPYERALSAARGRLSAAAFDAAWEAGQTLGLEQVVALALQDL